MPPATGPITERCLELFPELVSVQGAPIVEQSFCDTLLDGRTYRALVRNLTEEVAVHSTDGRIERDVPVRRDTQRSRKS